MGKINKIKTVIIACSGQSISRNGDKNLFFPVNENYDILMFYFYTQSRVYY